jgi:mRNA-degrading endonuclease HigB of HigAB toxin-antitoxin module
MIMKNKKALQEFMAKIAQAQELLTELQAHVDEHMNESPETVNWGMVGSAGYMVEKLSELADWAYQRGEYAK